MTVNITDFSSDQAVGLLDLAFRPADPDQAKTLTRAQVDQFNREGFVAPLPVFDDAEVQDIRAYFDTLIDEVVNADDRRNSYSINAYHLVCAGLYDLMLTPRILDLVQDIIGPDIITWGSQVFCKLAGDHKQIPLHQDATYWPLTPTKSVTVWLAIDDADEENGAMEFAPGSHRLGPLPHVEHELDGTRVLKRGVADPDQYDRLYVDALPAGSISMHNDLLLHGSGPNRSDRRRAGLTIRYAAAEVRTLPGYEQWAIPAIHCRGTIGAHWPHRDRPDSEHPEKMRDWTGVFDGNPPDAG